ncbi:hypothetical protein N7452_002211 [Penicillium brevicompactum]|uniref:Uncharacterized protein n=1 Tax=Penicillium brevicompactum TaxID=5074 RepID=A0A9W9R3U8_PENBR|nr:hypothetical protein N7452_002211 [Penicillium brevicompactum]
MAPSTVFSYWRRDHRRSSASPATLAASSPSSKGGNGTPISSPPQIPEIVGTPKLTTTFSGRPSHDESSSIDSPLELDASKLNISSSAAPLSSSLTLAVPTPAYDKGNRPHSSPGDCEGEHSTSQLNNPQTPSVGLHSDQGDGESNHKSSSPFRRSFGKQKRSPTAAAGSGHFRFRTSPEDSPADKQSMPKDFKVESSATAMKRAGDRDASGEQSHHKSGKAMLHLLNPMSLLARRRSAQIVNSRAEDVKITNRNVPAMPDDYDPRIRGKIIHDFSAPRPRRNVSATRPESTAQYTSSSQMPSNPHRSSWNDQSRPQSDRSPVFKEHFEDQNVLQPENKGYLQSSLLTSQHQPGQENSLPVFARNLPSHLPEQNNEPSPHAEQPEPEVMEVSSVPEPKPEADTEHQDQDTIPHAPYSSSGLPRHLKSNASRFSFDMSGVESSTQEKMLEEKHKAKEACRKVEDGYFDDFDDDFDNDMLDDLDGLEEKIPGVNVDADDDDYDYSSISANINDAAKSWAIPGLSPVVASPITPAPPNQTNTSYFEPVAPVNETIPLENEQPDQEQDLVSSTTAPQTQAAANQHSQVLDDDDELYFDDGEFGDLDINDETGEFDENIFDDVTSHLYDRKTVNAPAAPPADDCIHGDNSPGRESFTAEPGDHGLKHMTSVASDHRAVGSIKRGPLGEPIPNMGPSRAHGGVLTEQNLDLLHNALAFAASESNQGGRFDRTFSTSERSQGQDSAGQASQTLDAQPGLVSDESRVSQSADHMGFEDVLDDGLYDDFDDSYFDDAIVAAANAEALENDDDGFYGQEFGFYAHADNSDSSELTNGGYFGPRRVEGITRNHSSSRKFQEPSLTPITERSEWSTRNSMISLKAHGATHGATHPNSALASPGLAQLVDMGNLDDEMSLSALMKLRRGAWGGSNGSLRSSAGSPPQTMSPSHRTSFTGAEASPTVADAKLSFPDEGPTSVGYFRDDGHSRTASPLPGRNADLPTSGITRPTAATDLSQVPVAGSERLNVL